MAVMSIIEIDHRLTSFDRVGSVQFQLFRVQCTLSYMDFTIFLKFYNSEFITIEGYDQLLIDYPRGEMVVEVWNQLCSERNYELGFTKGRYIVNPALRYIYAVIAQSFTTRVDNQWVVGHQQLLYLFSMTDHRSLYLGFILAEFPAHQGQHTSLSSIFSRPYVTRVI